MPTSDAAKTRLIKKYPNRRLYDTNTSSYITMEDIESLVHSGEDIQIIDNKTGKDITRGILMQIINDLEEKSPQQMFSNAFLSQVIKSYGTDMQNTLVLCFNKTLDLYLGQEKHMRNPDKSPHQLSPDTYFNSIARENISRWQKSWENLKTKPKK
ncbi:polyhydroxyalkanoate synthesis repressor PhaR [Facilibium subflavum]|uniref:polyhydroxyalkanoate synthesis repressor PhaR n=1 Tax=Facilibium subflavum TaxID=2219058 RepID=UPI000E64713F|nr:polyhydroxyalkanoate synthesis repressor PhaR [Facilibium subflavum]